MLNIFAGKMKKNKIKMKARNYRLLHLNDNVFFNNQIYRDIISLWRTTSVHLNESVYLDCHKNKSLHILRHNPGFNPCFETSIHTIPKDILFVEYHDRIDYCLMKWEARI